jgi:hypothetical protein
VASVRLDANVSRSGTYGKNEGDWSEEADVRECAVGCRGDCAGVFEVGDGTAEGLKALQ